MPVPSHDTQHTDERELIKQQTQDSSEYRAEAAVTARTNQSNAFTLSEPFTTAHARGHRTTRTHVRSSATVETARVGGHYAIQRHVRSPILTIKSPYATSY